MSRPAVVATPPPISARPISVSPGAFNPDQADVLLQGVPRRERARRAGVAESLLRAARTAGPGTDGKLP